MEQLNKQIKKLILLKQDLEILQRHINQINKQIKIAFEQKKALEEQFLKEQDDVFNLEKNNLRAIFLEFLGQDDKALEVERQEMLHAYMQLQKSELAFELLNFEKGIIMKKINVHDFDLGKLNLLLNEKEALLREDLKANIKLKDFDFKVEKIYVQIIEIKEAKEVCISLKKLFKDLDEELALIENWNQAHYAFHGKANYSSYNKKKYVSRNIELISRIELKCADLQKELDDLKTSHELDLSSSLDMLDKFFVFFLDNLITDWVVKKGIKNASDLVDICSNKLKRLEMTLDHEESILSESLADLEQQRTQTIIDLKI